jgi:hypothetical protein
MSARDVGIELWCANLEKTAHKEDLSLYRRKTDFE